MNYSLLVVLATLGMGCGGQREMDEGRFWEIIEATGSPYHADAKEQALRFSLATLSPDDVLVFDRIYHEKMRRAYTWDLWAAGFIIGGGCWDDGFTTFRNFVIGHGRTFYEAAVAEPDSMSATLGSVPESGGLRLPYLPLSDLIPGQVYEELTGDPPPFQLSATREPAGVRWTESQRDLSRICPKLWSRFGGEWIRVFEPK